MSAILQNRAVMPGFPLAEIGSVHCQAGILPVCHREKKRKCFVETIPELMRMKREKLRTFERAGVHFKVG
jgi:hypothetical protein